MPYRARLRPKYTDDQLHDLYAKPHNHTRWHDHHIRVDTTIATAHWMHVPQTSVADLSCGDAAIANALAPNASRVYLGDYAPGYEYHGAIEETLSKIPRVGTFICSETLEHLDNPDAVLAAIRQKADRLILSTPIYEEESVGNLEHYWGWSCETIEEMLKIAGWRPTVLNRLELRDYTYDFQIWGCG